MTYSRITTASDLPPEGPLDERASEKSDLGSAIVPVGEPFLLKRPLRFGTDEWGFVLNLNTGKFEVYRTNRPDLAHLTIMWGTRSGDLDVHLTYRHEGSMADGNPKDYVPLFTMSRALLEAAGIAYSENSERIMIPHLRRTYRKFRPGWLAHQNYFVTVFDNEMMMKWFRDLAPKRGRKYRFDPRRLDPQHYPPEMLDCMYDPHVLHYLEEDELKAPVSASRIRRGHIVKEDGILLYFMSLPDGTTGWYGMKQRDVTAMMRDQMRYVFDKLVPLVQPGHADIWEKVVRGLGMNDFEGTRHMAHMVRQFLTNPRNLVGQPYPDPPKALVFEAALDGDREGCRS